MLRHTGEAVIGGLGGFHSWTLEQGMIFIGPLLILVGMGMVTMSKEQFSGSHD